MGDEARDLRSFKRDLQHATMYLRKIHRRTSGGGLVENKKYADLCNSLNFTTEMTLQKYGRAIYNMNSLIYEAKRK